MEITLRVVSNQGKCPHPLYPQIGKSLDSSRESVSFSVLE